MFPLITTVVVVPAFSSMAQIENGRNGAPFIRVVVKGAKNNPQLLLIDTGSPYTYLLDHSEYEKLRNVSHHRGFKNDAVSQISTKETSVIDFVGVAGLVTKTWTRKSFTVGTHSWNQKFAIAKLPPSQHASWNPKQAGSIGANKDSKFCEMNPVISFVSTSIDSDQNRLFLFGPIPLNKCRDSRIVRIPADDSSYFWATKGSVKIGPNSLENRELVFDSGTSFLMLPVGVFKEFKNHLVSLNIGSLRFDKKMKMTPISIGKSDLVKIPKFDFSLFDGAIKFALPNISLVQCVGDTCRLLIGRPPADDDDLDSVILGRPFFRAFNIELNVRDNTIRICEPVPTNSAARPYLLVDPSKPLPVPGPRKTPSHPPQPPKRKPQLIQPDDESLIAPRLSNIVQEGPGNPAGDSDETKDDQSEPRSQSDESPRKDEDNKGTTTTYNYPIFLSIICILIIH